MWGLVHEPKSVVSSSTTVVDDAFYTFTPGPASNNDDAFVSFVISGDTSFCSRLLSLQLLELCDALQSRAVQDELRGDPKLATLLLYRVAHGTDDAEAVSILLAAGACPRGGLPPPSSVFPATATAAAGAYYREYLWFYRMDDAGRSAVRRAAGSVQLTAGQRERLMNGRGVATLHCIRVLLDGATVSSSGATGGTGTGTPGAAAPEAATWRALRRQEPGQHDCDAHLDLMASPMLEPLHLAADANHADVCAVLLKAGASPGVTARQAVERATVDPMKEDKEPHWALLDSPLSRAAHKRSHRAVRLMLQHITQGQAAAAVSTSAPAAASHERFKLSGRQLGLLLRNCGFGMEVYCQLLQLALPLDCPDVWLEPCNDASGLYEMEDVTQALVYEAGGYTPYRRVLLMLQATDCVPQRVDRFLEHVLGVAATGPRRRPAAPGDGLRSNATLCLALLNGAMAQSSASMLHALLGARVVQPLGGTAAAARDLVHVPLLQAALRAESAPCIIEGLLLTGCVSTGLPGASSLSRGDRSDDEDALGDARLAEAWQERAWLGVSSPMDVALTVLKRAFKADMAKERGEFVVDSQGHCPVRAARLLANVEVLVAAARRTRGGGKADDRYGNARGGSLGGSESAADIVNELFDPLVQSWKRARAADAGGHGAGSAAAAAAAAATVTTRGNLAARLARLTNWAVSTWHGASATQGAAAGGGGQDCNLTLSKSLKRRGPNGEEEQEHWQQGAGRYLRMLLLVGEDMRWTPAMHMLWPGQFKAATHLLLLAAHRGSSPRNKHSAAAEGRAGDAAGTTGAAAGNGHGTSPPQHQGALGQLQQASPARGPATPGLGPDSEGSDAGKGPAGEGAGAQGHALTSAAVDQGNTPTPTGSLLASPAASYTPFKDAAPGPEPGSRYKATAAAAAETGTAPGHTIPAVYNASHGKAANWANGTAAGHHKAGAGAAAATANGAQGPKTPVPTCDGRQQEAAVGAHTGGQAGLYTLPPQAVMCIIKHMSAPVSSWLRTLQD